MAVLLKNLFIEIVPVEPAADSLADKGSEHQGGDKGEFVGHFENNEDAGHRRAHYCPQTGAHSDNCQRHLIRLRHRKEKASEGAQADARHCPEEQGWRKDASTSSKPKAGNGGSQFRNKEHRCDFPPNAASQRR
ncbi:hypothetical protein SDC9_188859 [bioreactor metagenome]|uniref:Uncharacterized protein n=1 Tax=bioreactor metagenome TaxID=1076179 RepID=A0A645HRU1_9ZZZZ